MCQQNFRARLESLYLQAKDTFKHRTQLAKLPIVRLLKKKTQGLAYFLVRKDGILVWLPKKNNTGYIDIWPYKKLY